MGSKRETAGVASGSPVERGKFDRQLHFSSIVSNFRWQQLIETKHTVVLLIGFHLET